MSSTNEKTPFILAIDTSSSYSSYAIACGDKVIASLSNEPGTPHSQTIFSSLSKILEEANLKIEDIDIYAAVVGPGSFTGLRVGLAAVKGLADTMNKPVYSIGSIDAVALSSGVREPMLIIIEAGRSEVYAGLREIKDLMRLIRGGGDDADDTVGQLDSIKERFPDAVIVRGGELKNIASSVAIEAYRMYLDDAPSGITPIYIRPSDAERNAKNSQT